jgi:glycosyltransferase involved in cell wall biosynthesis
MANRNPTIVVPVHGRIDLTERCLRAIDDLTNVSVPLLLIDDCGDPPLGPEFVARAIRSGRRTTFVQHADNQGFVATKNEAFERTAGADVVLVNSDVTVLPGWLSALRLALSAVPDLASASALDDRGGILSCGIGAPRSYPRADGSGVIVGSRGRHTSIDTRALREKVLRFLSPRQFFGFGLIDAWRTSRVDFRYCRPHF